MELPEVSALRERLARAQADAVSCLAAWERHGRESVSQEKLEHAQEELAILADQLAHLDSGLLRLRRAQLAFDRVRGVLARLLGLGHVEWLPAALLIATPVLILTAPLLVALGFGLGGVVAGLLASFAAAFLASAYFLRSLDRSNWAGRAGELRLWVGQRKRMIDEVKGRAEGARRNLERLEAAREMERRYRAALAELARAEAALADRRLELAARDWRSLRGVAFEGFLSEVFRELGYGVETTKTSGDQGVDLILTGRGERVAVQSKGYADNVGNGAIQEAFAGMAFYGCHRCVAVTNAGFTPAARELARRVGCLLIDGAMIQELIEGRVPGLGQVQRQRPHLTG